jgi:hypothetical protein
MRWLRPASQATPGEEDATPKLVIALGIYADLGALEARIAGLDGCTASARSKLRTYCR